MPKPEHPARDASGSDLLIGTREGRLVAHANPALQQRSQRSVQKLLAGAEAVLARDGWAAFTINSVAAETGVSVGGIYRRFTNKEQLLRAMDKFKFGDAWDQVAAGRDKIFPSTASKAMADKIRKFLSRRLGPETAKVAA